MIPRTCSVALPIPAESPYSYSVPTALASRISVGSRVVVSVRSRLMVGVVVGVSSSVVDDLKPVMLSPDSDPLISEGLVELATWIAGYYVTPIGLAMRAMLPGTLWGSSRVIVHLVDRSIAGGGASRNVVDLLERSGGRAAAATLSRQAGRPIWDTLQRLEQSGAITLETEAPNLGPAPGTVRFLRLDAPPETLMDLERLFGRAKKQRDAFEIVNAMGGEVAITELKNRHGVSAAVVKGLIDRGVASVVELTSLRDPFANLEATPPVRPDPQQIDAIRRIRQAPPGSVVSLFGVTGSGKTAVYLEAVREEVESGRGAIVLVPEIALTPQTIARVRGAFGDQVAVLHSALSDGERADAWRALAAGAKRVAVGARSAVFAPIRDLAAIIVDEEHEASYKNGEAPRYNARDVAVRRAAIEGAKAILCSATPALETWAARERIDLIRLPERAAGRSLPEVRLIDLSKEERVSGTGSLPWSRTLDERVEERLSRGEQVILLLNRRGFAHFQQCGSCGEASGCPHCSVALTVHTTPSRLFCHHCGHSESLRNDCAVCGHETTVSRGVGTQQLEKWLGERFPEARLARMDADTTGTKWAHHRILEEFGKRRIDVLFGTQMIAKGLDFPDVTLVGVVDADTSLNLPDFRAAERTFQLVSQVAGRSGRGEKGGEVIVQTRTPDHYALVAAIGHDYETFARTEMEKRGSPRYPPHVGLVNVVFSGLKEIHVGQAAADLSAWLRELVDSKAEGDADVIGPAPAPLARIKKRWRWHTLLRSANRALLGRLIQYSVGRVPGLVAPGVRVIFDRDPVSLL